MTTVEDMEFEAPATTPGSDGSLWRGRWALVLMLVSAALTGPIGYAGQLGYAALLGVVGIASLPMLGVKRPPVLGIGVLMLLALWACVTMSWSVAAPHHPDFLHYKGVEQLTALKLVLEVALYGAFFFLMRELPGAWANRILMVLAVSLMLSVAAMCIDAFSNCALYRWFRLEAHAADLPSMIQTKAARGCYTVALLFWPTTLWMWRRGWTVPAVGFGLVFVAAAIGLSVDTPMLAVVLGGLALFAVRRFGAYAVWALLGVTIVYFALSPILIDALGPHLPALHNNGVSKESWGARVAIWRFVSDRIVERPWLGWGMDASRMWPDVIPLHPHNAALQLWFELGVVGAALAALFWVWLWARIGAMAEDSRTDAGVAAAVAVAYLTIGALSFGIWQEWWLALGVLGAAVCLVFNQAFQGWTGAEELQELVPID